MPLDRSQAQAHADRAADAVLQGSDVPQVIDAMPAPAYITDADGNVTYWNRACVDFAGREPQLGTDKWCVTWRLFETSGERLPHDRCPMAEAIGKRAPVRGAIAIAQRPDGSRRAFTPYPTPLLDGDGALVGAVNLLLDITGEQAVQLAEQAARCRRLADATVDRRSADVLRAMAAGYDENARALAAAA